MIGNGKTDGASPGHDRQGLEKVRVLLEPRVLLENHTQASGGGMALTLDWYSSITLKGLELTGNKADGQGGGAYLRNGADLQAADLIFRGNQAAGDGGAVGVAGSSKVTLQNCRVTGNEAVSQGGALYLGAYFRGSSSDPQPVASLRNCVVVGNKVTEGVGSSETDPCGRAALVAAGGGGTVDLVNAIIAYNFPGNLQLGGGNIPGHSNALFQSSGMAFNYSQGVSLTTTYLEEPGFLRYQDSAGVTCPPEQADCLPIDCHLATDSPLIDQGASIEDGYVDPDGSPPDLGIYGSPYGDAWDLDGDGYPDWFWPGARSDAPAGFRASDYDADDLDADLN